MVANLVAPDALLQPFALNGDKNVIPKEATGTQAASLDEGFPIITSTSVLKGGIPPQRTDFNGLGYLLSSQFFYLQNGGNFTFNQTVSDAIGGYPQGAILNWEDTSTGAVHRVKSLIPNNTYNFVITPSYVDGSKWEIVFREIPSQLGNNGKYLTTNGTNLSWSNVITGAATTIQSSNLTASRALVSNSSGKVAVSNTTSTELGYLSGVTSTIQTQLNNTVKISGNQIIAGSKTFSSSLTTQTGGSAMLKGVLPNNTVGTNPSSSVNVYVAGVDSGGKDQSYISFGVDTVGTGFTNVMARSNSTTDRGSVGIQIGRRLDGTSWTNIGTTTITAPTPATADNSTKIATTANVDAKITAQAVKLTGNQTINGVKTFSSSPKVPTVATSTNDTTAASCQWVTNKINASAETIVGWGMPDYSAEVSQTWNTEYTATEDRNVMVTSGDYYGTKTYFVINGIEYTIGSMSSNAGTCMNTTNFLIKKGTVYKAYGGYSNQSIKYQPLTGVN